MDEYRMARRVLKAEVSGGRVRGRHVRIKQTVYSRRWGRVEETGGPAHSDGVAICRSSNA